MLKKEDDKMKTDVYHSYKTKDGDRIVTKESYSEYLVGKMIIFPFKFIFLFYKYLFKGVIYIIKQIILLIKYIIDFIKERHTQP